PEGRLSKVKVSGPTEIVLDAYPDRRLRGEVTEIVPKVDRAKATVMVKVRFIDPHDGVMPDMAARVSFLQSALDEASMQQPAKLAGIKKTFWRGKEPVHVRNGLDLEIAGGSFEALMGPSGSGKSTLLNLIAGLDRPSEGLVEVAGKAISAMGEGELAKWRSQ